MQDTFTKLIKELQSMPIRDIGLYEQLKATKGYINVLEERYEELTKIAMDDMKEKGIHKFESDFGKFSIAERAKWKYSENVEQYAETLKSLKKAEEESGVATKEITNYLLVK